MTALIHWPVPWRTGGSVRLMRLRSVIRRNLNVARLRENDQPGRRTNDHAEYAWASKLGDPLRPNRQTVAANNLAADGARSAAGCNRASRLKPSGDTETS